MRRREWMQATLGMAGSLVVAGRSRADDPQDDSDPAPLLKNMGPMMMQVPITVAEISPALHVVQGPGGNIAVLNGPDGLLVVDSGVPMRAKDVFDAVAKVGGKPVITLVNTHWHFDHAGGNETFGKAGAHILSTEVTRKRLATEQYSEVFKMTTPASPPVALPSACADQMTLHVGDETLHLMAVPPAHTDGDLIVHFTKADVIHTGDLFSNGFYPNIDGSSRGWIGGMVAAADVILRMAGPNTKIIPGHGPLATKTELTAARKMLQIIHDRLAKLAEAGKTMEEAIAAKPTKDLDANWGKGLFTGGMFTRVAYDGLLKHRVEKKS